MGRFRGAVWVAMLGLAQAGDVWTTALDRARGGWEAMPLTAGVLEAGGVWGLALLKALVVAAMATALLLTLRWSARRPEAAALHSFVLNGCRVAVVAIALASLNNAVLLASL